MRYEVVEAFAAPTGQAVLFEHDCFRCGVSLDVLRRSDLVAKHMVSPLALLYTLQTPLDAFKLPLGWYDLLENLQSMSNASENCQEILFRDHNEVSEDYDVFSASSAALDERL